MFIGKMNKNRGIKIDKQADSLALIPNHHNKPRLLCPLRTFQSSKHWYHIFTIVAQWMTKSGSINMLLSKIWITGYGWSGRSGQEPSTDSTGSSSVAWISVRQYLYIKSLKHCKTQLWPLLPKNLRNTYAGTCQYGFTASTIICSPITG